MASPTSHHRLKVERAKTHIQELHTQIQSFWERKPYAIFVERDEVAGKRVWKLRVNECVPLGWGTLIGDAIHNIRASLDTLLCSVIRHCDPTRNSVNHVQFVVRETQREFEADLPRNTKGASPDAIKLIHDLKPYTGGNDALWRLHRLDILDKHQAIVPVGAAYRAVDISSVLSAGMAKAMADAQFADDPPRFPPLFLRPADRQFPLQDGAALFAVPLDHPPFKDDEIRFSFDIAFGEGQIVDGEPVIPALRNFVNVVEGVFDVFERDILK